MIKLFGIKDPACRTTTIIEEEIAREDGRNTVFIAPESSKAVVERVVSENIRKIYGTHRVEADPDIIIESSFVGGDVLSFIRLAVRILEMTGRDYSGADQGLLRNAIYRVLAEHMDEFKTFGKLAGRFEYIDELIILLGDFMRFGITEEGIASAYEAADGADESYLHKLHDLKLLTMYLKKLGEIYETEFLSDPISGAAKLLGELAGDPALRKKRRMRPLVRFLQRRFVVLGFGTTRLLTPVETELVGKMSALGSEIVFFPLVREDGREESSDMSVYGDAFTDLMMSSLPDVSFEEYKGKAPYEPCRASLDYAAGAGRSVSPDCTKTDRIMSVTLPETDDRIAFVSNEIIRLTRGEDALRYKDIRVVCVDEDMVTRLPGIMKLYGLHIFTDRKITLENTPVFRYLSLLSELPLRGYDTETILKLMRTGLVPVRYEDADLFENYCLRYNISGESRIFDREFFVSPDKYPMKAMENGWETNAAEYLWENVVERVLVPVCAVAKKTATLKTISDKARCLAEHIDSLSKNMDALTKEWYGRNDDTMASALVRGYNEVMTLLVNLSSEFNNVKISQEAFCSLIRIDMRNKSAGTIPLKADSVEIVSVEEAFLTPCKALFILDARNDNFPYSRTFDTIMTRNELAKLSEAAGVDLPDKADQKHKTEFISAALMLNSCGGKIVFVNSREDEKSFCCLFFEKYTDQVLKDVFRTPVYGFKTEKRHDFEHASLSPEDMDILLGDGLRVSVSSLEKYNKCPMQYMMTEVLKIDRRTDGTRVGANDMGTVMHNMLERGVSDAVEEYRTPGELLSYSEKIRADKDLLEKTAQRYFLEFCNNSGNINMMSDEFKALVGRKARRMFGFIFPEVLREAGENGYVPCRFEMKIRDIDPPLQFDISGKKFLFTGSIDRVDRHEDGSYRIVDYKTGSKKIELDKTLAGLQIQLYAYANAAGAEFGDDKVTEAGYSEIGLKPSDKGTKPEATFTGLKKEEFDIVRNYVGSLMRENCGDIAKGKAPALINSKENGGNYGRGGCEYCPFKGGCGNSYGRPRVRMVSPPEEELPEGWAPMDGKKIGNKDRIFYTMIKRTEKDNG